MAHIKAFLANTDTAKEFVALFSSRYDILLPGNRDMTSQRHIFLSGLTTG
jgi:hypothetical protein